jgi:predicted enzyme related to lactoylglutathione lyase
MNLSTVRVFVNDIAIARRFYAEQLALPLKADGTEYGYCVFSAGSTELVVETVPDDAPDEDRALVGRFTGLSFTVQDVDQKHQELVAMGVHFTGLPEKQFWGGILATLQDPAGNLLQICQLPTEADR